MKSFFRILLRFAGYFLLNYLVAEVVKFLCFLDYNSIVDECCRTLRVLVELNGFLMQLLLQLIGRIFQLDFLISKMADMNLHVVVTIVFFSTTIQVFITEFPFGRYVRFIRLITSPDYWKVWFSQVTVPGALREHFVMENVEVGGKVHVFTKVTNLPSCQVIVCERRRDKFYPIAQAFFYKIEGSVECLLTARHVFGAISGKVYITKDLSNFYPVVENSDFQTSLGPVEDVISFQVARGTITKMKASLVKIADTVPNGSRFTVYAGGISHDQQLPVLCSTGIASGLEGTAGVFTCGHNAATKPGFSGAPAMIGKNLAAFLHTGTLEKKINIGVYLYPVIADAMRLPKDSPILESCWGMDDYDDYVDKYSDFTVVKDGKGRFSKYYTVDYDELAAEYEQDMDDDEYLGTNDYGTYGKVGKRQKRNAKKKNKGFFEGVSLEADRNEDEGFIAVNVNDDDAQPDIRKRVPRENLDPITVATALAAYRELITNASIGRNNLDTLGRGLNLLLARHNKEEATHLAADVALLQQVAESVKGKLFTATELFNTQVMKSKEDQARSKNWAAWRARHARIEPSPEAMEVSLLYCLMEESLLYCLMLLCCADENN